MGFNAIRTLSGNSNCDGNKFTVLLWHRSVRATTYVIESQPGVEIGRGEFAHFRQPTDPGHPTTKVIKTGVFAISRNPLYLGGVLVLLGIALALNMLWALVMLLLSMILCYYILIIPEERYLSAKFGDEYKEYVASVHRWLGRK